MNPIQCGVLHWQTRTSLVWTAAYKSGPKFIESPRRLSVVPFSYSQMPQPAPSTPTQSFSQDRFAGGSFGPSPARAPNATPPSFTQHTVPLHNPQYPTGSFRDLPLPPAPAGVGYYNLNDAHAAGSALGHGLNYTMTDLSGPDFLPLNRGQYTMPTMPGYFGQGAPNDAGYMSVINQFPGHPINVAQLLPGAYRNAAPNNDRAPQVWQLFDCWVPYAEQDELHLTIVFKRIPSA
ncbi:hypothetical protein BGW80DRAFT_852887 [Lactifluus volemus]|nr:hypothetical protein BGW80DRAFT_852887 [Lactifluus volemus]